jgi:hypothetical protein
MKSLRLQNTKQTVSRHFLPLRKRKPKEQKLLTLRDCLIVTRELLPHIPHRTR